MSIRDWPTWRSFLFTCIFQVSAPIFPLLIEAWLDVIKPRSLFLVAMLYPLCLAAASREFLFFVVGTVIGLFAGIAYGITVTGSPPPRLATEAAYCTILFSAVIFAIGSAKQHFRDGKIALQFGFSESVGGLRND